MSLLLPSGTVLKCALLEAPLQPTWLNERGWIILHPPQVHIKVISDTLLRYSLSSAGYLICKHAATIVVPRFACHSDILSANVVLYLKILLCRVVKSIWGGTPQCHLYTSKIGDFKISKWHRNWQKMIGWSHLLWLALSLIQTRMNCACDSYLYFDDPPFCITAVRLTAQALIDPVD